MAAKKRKKTKKSAALARQLPAKSQKKAAVSEAGGDAGVLIDMNEAIRLLKTTRATFYRWLRAGKFKGMKIGRQWRFYQEDIERFLKGETPRIDLPADIKPLMQALRQRLKETGVKELPCDGQNLVQQTIRLMVVLGVATRASDIHISPHLPQGCAQSVAVLRYRLDGILHQFADIDMRLLPAIIAEWKKMAACAVTEKERPQDARILMKLPAAGGAESGKLIDLRVSFLPTGLGEAVTARILDEAAASFDLDQIDYSPADRERLMRALNAGWGTIVVTGPTGSGKTTTLYCCLNKLARPEIKVMTVEDPIEYFLPWTTQVALNLPAGLTFPRALRAILRSDPDVILVGEIRDGETCNVVHQVALTGHLVLTTLHADEAARALKRLVEIGSDPFVVADSTKLILAQRLIRKLCPHCGVAAEPPATRLDLAAEAARQGGVNWHSLKPAFRQAVGCEKCGRTGYLGRTVIAETLAVTSEIGRALRNDASVEELRTIAVGQGMTTMAAAGVLRAAKGETSLDEVMRVVG